MAIKNSVYVLPANEKTHEDFQWLKQEIESAGGEAAVFRAGSVEGATDKEIVAAFQKARDEEFANVTAQLDGLAGSIREQTRGRHLTAGRLASHETELERLHSELERVIENDFFEARTRSAALRSYERCQQLLRAAQAPDGKPSGTTAKDSALAVHDYQGRRWVTRHNIHIDRLASAWLIKQFIDKRPRFYFVTEGAEIENGIPFDMFGVELTHHGEDCTFETIVKRFGLGKIKGLRELGQIVHDVDLKDDKFHRLEAAGLKAVIDGLCERVSDDRKRLQQASIIFDGLFTLFDKTDERQRKTTKRKRARKKSWL